MPRRRHKKRLHLSKRFPFIKLSGLGEPTKQDFVAVAKIFCHRGASPELVGDFADYFASQNPRFRRDLFIGATKKC